ncbi:hypothetical protein DY000_02008917 [Brassica cretica]|uniref:Uncharacterized protein n=1 Tax=Brassica cretica TaxID=69181 RepID=A0ABQ7BUQ5_BRACR|nr:hypothetical protein DY000_02008917 [Brassica cretica]
MEENFVRRLPRSPDDFTGSPDNFTGSPDDFQEAKTTLSEDFVRRLPGSPDDFQTTNISIMKWRLRQKTSWKSSGRLPRSCLEDFFEVVWTSWKSSGLHGSHLDFKSRYEKSAYPKTFK